MADFVTDTTNSLVQAHDQAGDPMGTTFNNGVVAPVSDEVRAPIQGQDPLSNVVTGPVTDEVQGPVAAESQNNAAGQNNSQPDQNNANNAQVRDLGIVKWQANPYPTWATDAVNKFSPILGSGLGLRYGGMLGGALSGGELGAWGGPVGAAAGAAIGGFAGGYGGKVLDYVGMPSNIQVTAPALAPPNCNGDFCDRSD